ncbi:MAG TPA: ATP synthase F1 subunit epsilon [Candidatus Limiplasma sp.]|nr:ATP synthase F1 subunit epsilon [Candidatus Limiplasma sp.]HPS81763.1 ATP synthase F1 subunit epsilon [Candidatus Limiplasma sp.]
MAKTFHLSILTPEHEFFSGQVEMLDVSAIDGKLCVLADHAPTVVGLTEGELNLRDENGVARWAAASDGFMTITQDETVVMLQSAEWPENIDRMRAERAERNAREALLQKQDRQSYLMNQAMLLRAMTRLRVSDHHGVNQ